MRFTENILNTFSSGFSLGYPPIPESTHNYPALGIMQQVTERANLSSALRSGEPAACQGHPSPIAGDIISLRGICQSVFGLVVFKAEGVHNQYVYADFAQHNLPDTLPEQNTQLEIVYFLPVI